MSRRAVPLALAFALLHPVVAHADAATDLERELRDTLEDMAGQSRALAAIAILGYALRDPEQMRILPAQIWGSVIEDPILGPVMANLGGLYRNGYVRIDVNAGAVSDLDVPGAISAAVDASWELPLCRVLGVAGAGQLGYVDGDALKSYAATASACLPLPANTIYGSYTHRSNVRASLFERTNLVRARQTNDIVDGHVRFYRWLGTDHQIDVGPVDVVVDRAVVADATGSWVTTLAAAPAHWHRRRKGLAGRDQIWKFFEIGVVDLSDDPGSSGATAGHLAPLAIDGIHVADAITVGLGVGGAFGAARARGLTVLDVSDVYADANLAYADGPFAAELRATRGLLTAADSQLVRENRVSANATVLRPRAMARVEGFVARATVLRDLPGSRSLVLAGGAIDGAWALHPNLQVVGRVETARSLAAVAATEPVEAAWELRATIGLQAHYDARSH